MPPYEIAERIREAAEEAKAEGLERGMRKGIREGEVRGIEKGLREGKEEGLREGETRKAIEIAKALLEKGMDANEVSEISGLSEGEILELSLP
uniref:Essential protein Yae1, N terminal n=1 Tax=Candidatus Kentrum sp. TUN TaxID=2126343 RepID=A0A451ADX0_9GAMM|nr:MAG: hypothetical protein BECKTUN1418D_GA0071000_12515 [Candidatus Kentron sp. TUN]